jgi:HNH endonuclease/Recombinase
MATRGTTASKAQIRKHWSLWLVMVGKFETVAEAESSWACWACGFTNSNQDDWVERAHITAYSDGGSNEPKNLHLLCRWCHLASELLNSDDYFNWFLNRTLEQTFRDALKKDIRFTSVSQRTKQGIAKAQAQGKKMGPPQIMDNETIKLIQSLKKSGMSLSGMARKLNAENVSTAREGSKWHPSTIKHVLERYGNGELV